LSTSTSQCYGITSDYSSNISLIRTIPNKLFSTGFAAAYVDNNYDFSFA